MNNVAGHFEHWKVAAGVQLLHFEPGVLGRKCLLGGEKADAVGLGAEVHYGQRGLKPH